MKRKRIFRILLLAVYLALVAWLCFGRFDNMDQVPKHILGIPADKIVHFLMFFPFPFLCFMVFDRFTTNRRQSLLFTGAVFLAGCLVAAATELGQAQTDWRSGDITDFLADALSLLVGSLIVFIADIRKQNRP